MIALSKPEIIYLGDQIPNLPTALALKQKLSSFIGQASLNLLDLGQKLWVAPCLIVAGLRELGYDCENFPPTKTLNIELEHQRRWYQMTIGKIFGIL